MKAKWKNNFPENPFGNCMLPPEVVLFFGPEFSVTISGFQSLISPKQLREIKPFHSVGLLILGKPLPSFTGHPNRSF